MTVGLYCVKDDLVGTFSFFGAFPNDGVATRSFDMACKNHDVPVTDLALYRIARYYDHDGSIHDSLVEFLKRGFDDEI